jgi:general secretion pathway protein A
LMYLDFYGFLEKPFNLTPDPRFLFLSKNHKEAFAHLLYGINNRTGFIALTGEVGSGKTTVLRALLGQLDVGHHRTGLIFNPCLSPPELVQNINREFGIPAASSGSSHLDVLNSFLLKENAEGRTVVLVIDEAQNLEPPVLEEIRLISNLETDRDKLIQIVLSGQPELLEVLRRKEMRQINQRITVRYHLKRMDFSDTVAYINHRLEVAGRRGGVVFSRGALRQIYRYSGGLPRLVNAACDRALLAGYTRNMARISSRGAAAGIKDIRGNAVFNTWKRRLILIPTLVILAVLFAADIYFSERGANDQSNALKDVTTAGEQMKKGVVTGEELSRAMAAELGKVSEPESARRAFNRVARFWNVQPVPESDHLSSFDEMERAAQERELRLYRFSGNLGVLLRIDHPAALELSLPGIPGKRFISLVGRENEKLLIDPPIAGRSALSFSEVEKHWSGYGFVLWRDSLNLLKRLSLESRGDPIKQLQGLLTEVGTYGGPLIGVYDDDTQSAVKKFQSLKGIEQDGIVGGQTLMLLYLSSDRFEVPRLTVRRK